MNKGVMNLVIKAIDQATPSLKTIGKGLGTLKNVGSKVGDGLKSAALGAIGIATAVAGFTIAATAAAADEEKQVARLNGILKQRGMLTDANAAAVENQIAKMENLAIADDQVRESLITATSFTKNFNDALKIQNVAADVAAAKNISLEEATGLVGKAYQGNTKGLKGLGVEVKKGAKGFDVLKAVLKKYKGAAEAAANTTSGKFTKAQLKLNNIMEDFGAKFLPIANAGLDFLNTTALPALGKAFDVVAPIVMDVGKGLADTFGPMIQDNITNMTKPGGVFDSVGKVVGPIFKDLGDKVGVFIGKLTGPDGLLTALGNLVGTLWGDGKGPLAVAVQLIGAALSGLMDIINGIVDAMISLVKGIQDFLKASEKAAGVESKLRVGGTDGPGFSGPQADVVNQTAWDFILRQLGIGGMPSGVAPTPGGNGNFNFGPWGSPDLTVEIGGTSVDGVVRDSLGRIIDTTSPGR
jgi:hypothetical protein